MLVLKTCDCGAAMQIRLRTVIFQNKVEIENVPIYSCADCQRAELFAPVKPELTGYIRTLGANPPKGVVKFEDISELGSMICKMVDRNNRHRSAGAIVEERINELLDLLLLAQGLGDEQWMADIRGRLKQITDQWMADARF